MSLSRFLIPSMLCFWLLKENIRSYFLCFAQYEYRGRPVSVKFCNIWISKIIHLAFYHSASWCLNLWNLLNNYTKHYFKIVFKKSRLVSFQRPTESRIFGFNPIFLFQCITKINVDDRTLSKCYFIWQQFFVIWSCVFTWNWTFPWLAPIYSWATGIL